MIENRTGLGYRINIPISISAYQANGNHRPKTNGNRESVDAQFYGGDANPLESKKARRFKTLGAFLILGVIALSVTGFFGWRFFRPRIAAFFRKPIESVKFTQLTDTGDLSNAALSSDGNFMAFVRADKVFLKDVVSNKEIPLDIPNVNSFSSLQFSTDGNFLYFRNTKSRYTSAPILKTSRFGGDSKVVAEQTFDSFSLSPDNKFLAYYLRTITEPNPRLMIRNLETKEEREIYQAEGALSICETCSPAWSADGWKIIHASQSLTVQPSKLHVTDVETATNETINLPKLRRFEQAAWFPDGQSFVVSASEDGKNFHLWKVYYPTGDAQPMTNGLSSYQNVIASADGKKFLALQTTENANIFITNETNLNEQKPLTTGNSNAFGQNSLTWIDEKNILFSSQSEQDLAENLWLIDADGYSKRQLTNETNSAWTPTSDGKFIYYSVRRNGFPSISRLEVSGQNLTEITNETDGGRRSPQISPDGHWLYYLFHNKDGGKIMRKNLLDQKEETFFENEKVSCGFFLVLSDDGKYLACPNWRFHERNHPENYTAEIAVFSTEDKNYLRFIPIAHILPAYRFSPDSKAIEFIASLDEGTQIMKQRFDETEPKPVFAMPKDRIYNFSWSKDGKKLAISRGQQYRDAVLLTDFDK